MCLFTQKVIPIEQGLKQGRCRRTGHRLGHTQKVIPIEQGLKPDGRDIFDSVEEYSEGHSNRTRIETTRRCTRWDRTNTQKVIPIEQGLKQRELSQQDRQFITQKVIPIEQGLKQGRCRRTGHRLGHTQKVIPIEQGLKPIS